MSSISCQWNRIKLPFFSILTRGCCYALLSFCWFDFSSGELRCCKSFFVLFFILLFSDELNVEWNSAGSFLLRFKNKPRYARLPDWTLFAQQNKKKLQKIFLCSLWRMIERYSGEKMGEKSANISNLPFKLTLDSRASASQAAQINIQHSTDAHNHSCRSSKATILLFSSSSCVRTTRTRIAQKWRSDDM